MIQEVKKGGGDLLVLDAGDLLFYKNVDHSLPSPKKKAALLDAQLIVEAFNLMGCDAVGVGVDELRLGVKDFAKVEKLAAFPFISANVVNKDGRQISPPSVVRNAGGLRWGIFSLMSANPAAPAKTRDWRVLDPVNTGRRVIKDLQGEADIIILLAAMPRDELMTLLPQLPGITIAVAGHHPNGIRNPVQAGQTIVVSSPGYGRYIGMLKLSLRALEAPFVDEARITSLDRELAAMEKRIKEGTAGSFSAAKERMDAELQALKRGNIYRNELIVLSSQFQEDQGVKQLIEDFKAKHQKLEQGCQ